MKIDVDLPKFDIPKDFIVGDGITGDILNMYGLFPCKIKAVIHRHHQLPGQATDLQGLYIHFPQKYGTHQDQ